MTFRSTIDSTDGRGGQPSRQGSSTLVSNRLVLFFPGFEAMSPDRHSKRFARAAAQAGKLFGFQIDQTVGLDGDNTIVASGSGGEWHTRTRIVMCDWSEIIDGYGARPGVVRLLAGLKALVRVGFNGTLARYLAHSRRYGLFFAFPLLLTIGCPILGFCVAGALTFWLDWTIATAIGVAFALILTTTQFRRFNLLFILDDWALADDLATGNNATLCAKISALAEAITRGTTADEHDEVVLVGHSLGAVLAILALSRALAAARPVSCIHIVTVGSSLLKVGLQPAAEALRAASRDVLNNPEISWTDCQSQEDVINFCVETPVAAMCVSRHKEPTVRQVDLARQILPENRLRFSKDIFRVHRQFVLSAECRSSYSLHVLLLGPNPIAHYSATGSIDHPPLGT